MVLFAFSLQDQVDKFGAYIGIAAFFGLAVLSLLYFAQAREVRRLREWAGRAPERAVELEQAVVEHAQEVRRAPVTPVPRQQPAPVAAQPLSPSVAVPATNGAVHLKPEEVAALAFARAAGVHEPHEPVHHSVPVAVAAPATELAEPEPAQALNGGGNGSRTVPAPATPAARRADVPPPPPLPPRRATAQARRAPAPPPAREGSSMVSVVIVAVVGVLAIGGILFLFLRGGDDPAKPTTPTAQKTATPADASGSGSDDSGSGTKAKPTPTPTPAPTKDTALIAVYNGTPQPGLAKTMSEQLQTDGYPVANIATDTAPPEQQRTTSVVMYRRGSKTAASGVAESLGITTVALLDDATTALIANAPKKWNVVVIVGSDKTS